MEIDQPGFGSYRACTLQSIGRIGRVCIGSVATVLVVDASIHACFCHPNLFMIFMSFCKNRR